jgi:phosphopantothenoylcysteine decarboxylase/phosphopantothenate--cysteine ligase
MGTALAEAAFLRGAHVIYLRAENAANPRYQIENYSFTTADNLERLLERFTPKADVIFHAAAVSDFTTNAHTTKISGNLEHAITLLPRAKILNLLKGWNPKAYVVGFKAEYEQNTDKLSKIAEEKRDLAGVDMIIANDISRIDRGFVADTNEVILVSSEMDPMVVPLNTKRVIAETILDEVIKRAFA